MPKKREDFTGPRGRRRHAGHGGQGADEARAERDPGPARRRHRLCHHQRPAAARHGHAVRCAAARYADCRLQRRAVRQDGISRSLSKRRCRPMWPRQAIELIRAHGLDAWVYRGNDWLITKADAPHVAREAWTVKFQPKVVADFADMLDGVAKIVGISDDLDKVRRCEADAQDGLWASARRRHGRSPTISTLRTRTQTKARWWNISRAHLDVPTRGNRHVRRPAQRRADVQAVRVQHRDGQCVRSGQIAGHATTDSYNDEGFAKAMERFVLGASD